MPLVVTRPEVIGVICMPSRIEPSQKAFQLNEHCSNQEHLFHIYPKEKRVDILYIAVLVRFLGRFRIFDRHLISCAVKQFSHHEK